MYLGWAKRQGYEGRIVDRCPNENGGFNSATIESEFECAYGYLLGEKGVHHLIKGSPNEFSHLEVQITSFLLLNSNTDFPLWFDMFFFSYLILSLEN
jgi:protein subunit release factor B